MRWIIILLIIGLVSGCSAQSPPFQIIKAGEGIVLSPDPIIFSGTISVSNYSGISNQTTSSLWTQSGSDIYYNSGNVGIGVADPKQKLHLKGELNITGSTGVQTLHTNNLGNLGIGTSASGIDSFSLETNGHIFLPNGFSIATYGSAGSSELALLFKVADVILPNDFLVGDSQAFMSNTYIASGGNFAAIIISNGTGNVGVGGAFSNATFGVAIGGTTIADAWTVRSDRNKKTQIRNYTTSRIPSIPTYRYHYKYKKVVPVYGIVDGVYQIVSAKEETRFSSSKREHIGFMTDEVPKDWLGTNGQGIDTYSVSVSLYTYIKELEKRIEVLERK